MVEEENAAELARSSEGLLRLARGLVGDRADAEDVVQDSWLAFLQGGRARARAVQPFLAGIARRMASVHRRTGDRRRAREQSVGRDEALPSARDVAERLELQRRVVECLLDLSEAHRRVLYLRYYTGLDAPAIAAREGLTPAAVRKRIERALADLRTRLDARAEPDGLDWRSALVPIVLATRVDPPAIAIGSGTARWAWSAGAAAAILVVVATIAGVRDHDPVVVTPVTPPAAAPGLPGRIEVASADAAPPARTPSERAAALDVDPPVPAAREHRVVARLVDADGRPLRGASLSVPETRVESHADERGEVVLLVPLDTFARVPRPVGASEAWVEARAPGRATRRIVRATSTADTTWLGDVVLDPGFRLTGRVEDEHGQPVAGARVVARLARSLDVEAGAAPFAADDPDAWQLEDPSGLGFGPNPDPRVASPRRVVTGDDGRFEIASLAAGTYELDATAGDRPWSRRAPIRLEAGADAGEIVVSLAAPTPEAFVHVHVLDARGAGVPHATVVLHHGDRRRAAFGTDEDGRVRLRARSEPWSVTAIATHAGLGPRSIDGLGAGTRAVEVRLSPAELVEVRVVDAEGAPVRAGLVHATPVDAARPSLAPWARLDARGRARVVVSERPFRLYVEAPGHEAVHTPPFDAGEQHPVVRVALDPRALGGRVVAGGKPLEGARVTRIAVGDGWHAVPLEGWSGSGEPFAFASEYALDAPTRVRMAAVTDADGRFVLGAPMDAPERVRFVVESSRGAWCSEPIDATTVEAAPLEFVAGGTIHGRLAVDGDVARAAGWRVVACHVTGVLASVVVDPRGQYELSGLPAGGWQVRAFAPDAACPTSRGAPVAVAPRVDVELTPGARVVHDLSVAAREVPVLRGRVAIDGRTDAALWTVRVVPLESGGATDAASSAAAGVRVGPDGRFEVPLRVGESYALLVTGLAEFSHWEIRDVVTAGRGGIVRDYDLATGEIRGNASVPEAREPAWLDYVWSGGGSLAVRVREIAGTAHSVVPLTRVPCGAGRIVVRGEETLPSSRPVDVPCGGVLVLSP